jgi:hypothetical protein
MRKKPTESLKFIVGADKPRPYENKIAVKPEDSAYCFGNYFRGATLVLLNKKEKQ